MNKDKNQSEMQRKPRQRKQNERLAKIYTVIAFRVKMLDKEICLWFSMQLQTTDNRMLANKMRK